jgi:hypothetical protein
MIELIGKPLIFIAALCVMTGLIFGGLSQDITAGSGAQYGNTKQSLVQAGLFSVQDMQNVTPLKSNLGLPDTDPYAYLNNVSGANTFVIVNYFGVTASNGIVYTYATTGDDVLVMPVVKLHVNIDRNTPLVLVDRAVGFVVYQGSAWGSKISVQIEPDVAYSHYDATKGYSVVSVQLENNQVYNIVLRPFNGTSFQEDLHDIAHISVFVTVVGSTAITTGNAWGYFLGLFTFNVPGLPGTPGIILSAFLDISIAIMLFFVIRSLIPTLGG